MLLCKGQQCMQLYFHSLRHILACSGTPISLYAVTSAVTSTFLSFLDSCKHIFGHTSAIHNTQQEIKQKKKTTENITMLFLWECDVVWLYKSPSWRWALAAPSPKETGCEGMVLIQLVHNRVHVFVNMILNSGFYKRQRICWIIKGLSIP